MFIPFDSITDLQLYNSCACWDQTSGESTPTIPTLKMPVAATEIPVVMNVTPREKKSVILSIFLQVLSPYPRNKEIKRHKTKIEIKA